MRYVRKKDSDTYHFCSNCTHWPTGTETVTWTGTKDERPPGELCDECLTKAGNGMCRATRKRGKRV